MSFFEQIFNQFFLERHVIFNLNITEKQMQTLLNVLIAAVDIKINQLRNKLRQFLQLTVQQSSKFQSFQNPTNDVVKEF